MADKVRFNIKNVHYALLTEGETNQWATPVGIPGAVSLSLSPQGDTKPFYADGINYYQSTANNGYSGDLEMALFPAGFLKDVFQFSEGSTSMVLTEDATKEPKPFALLFEEDGDATGTKYVMYKVNATRPDRSLETTSDSKEPKTQKISITCVPLTDGKVMAMTQSDTPAATLSGWYGAVYEETT